jgi:hypothetical protein
MRRSRGRVGAGDPVRLAAANRDAMLIDVSFSASTAPLDEESRFERAVHAVGSVLKAGDRAIVGLADNRAVFAPGFHGTAKDLVTDWKTLRNVQPRDRFGPSPLFDALEAAVEKLHELPGTRAVVLWTDGRPSGNVMGAEEVGTRAADADVALHVIVDGARSREMRVEKPCEVFDAMARMTGGGCVLNDNHRDAPTHQLIDIVRRAQQGR